MDPSVDEPLLWIHHGSPLTLLGHHIQPEASHPLWSIPKNPQSVFEPQSEQEEH